MLNVRRLIFFTLLFLHGAVSETGVFPRRCHIDSNHFLAKSISRGEWIGIEYDITYLKGMCDTDNRNGIFIASINGRNKSLKAREGFIVFDNVATVHFNLTSGKKGLQLFSSQICWSSANCTALCSSEPLGIVSSCTVGNTMDSLAILLFFVVPLFVCSFALLVCYSRIKILRRRGMLAFREQHRQEDISPAAAFEKNRKQRYDNCADMSPANSVETAVCEVTMVQGDGETTTREVGDMNESARSNSVKMDITNECERKPFEVLFLRENKNICEEEKSGARQQDNAMQTIVDITRDIKKIDNHALQYTHFRSTDSHYNCNAREKTKRESTQAAINAFQLKEEYIQHGVAEEEAVRRMHEVAEEEAVRRMHEVAEEEAARRMHDVAEEEAVRRMHEVAEEEAVRRMHEVAEEEAARRMHEVAEEEAVRRMHEVAEEEAVRRMHEVAEEEAARRMHEVAEEEAVRRMHEVAEEEAARRMHEVAEEEAVRRMHEVAEEEAVRRMHEVAEEEAARRMHEVAEEEAVRRMHEVAEEEAVRRMHEVAEEEAARRMHEVAEEEAVRRMHEVAEEEAVRRMHEVAEEEAVRRMHEVAEEEAVRRMHEVAEEEAARRMHEVAEEEAVRRMHEVAEEEAVRRMHEVAEEEAARRMHEVAEEEAVRRMHEVAEEEAVRRMHEVAEEEAARRMHEVAEEEAARRMHEVAGARRGGRGGGSQKDA
ncbi:hypothetical protein TcBrA4_0014910 [Trypanosoma cruzi]|nr:hypothetical protein TcBrA4_0014910 [Trypanosoma cruzi]